MTRVRKLPSMRDLPEPSRAADGSRTDDGAAVADVRAHLQTSLGSIESAVRALGLGGQAIAADRERWRRVATLLQQALVELEGARNVCARQFTGGPDPADPQA